MDPRRGAAACGLSLEIPSAAEQCEPVRDIEGGVSPAGRLREGSGERPREPAADIEVSRRSYVERRSSVRAANPGLAAVGSEKSCVGVMPQADWRRGRVKTFLCAYFIKLLLWANEPLPHREVGRKKV